MTKTQVIQEIFVERDTHKISLKNYLINNLNDVFPGSNQFKKRLKSRTIWVNGNIPSWDYILQSGDKIEITALQENRPKIDLKVDVVYEDEQCAVVVKPGGIIVSGNAKRTLENALPNVISPSKNEDALQFPSVAHRLDYGTSGLLLVAKTASFLRKAKNAFEQKLIHKEYHAVVVGEVEEKEFEVKLPIDDKMAITRVQLLDGVPSIHFGFLSFLKLKIETGRRHQIRKHLSNLGFPILGDQDYATPKQRLRGKGLFLCSTKIEFDIHQSISVEINPPEKFRKTLDRQNDMFQKKSGSNTTL